MLPRMCTVTCSLSRQDNWVLMDASIHKEVSSDYSDVSHSPAFCDGLCTPVQNSLLLSGWDGHKPGQRALYQETVAGARERKWQTQIRVKISNRDPWHHFRSRFRDYLEGRRFNHNQNGPNFRVNTISMRHLISMICGTSKWERGLEKQTQRQLKLVSVIVIVYYYLYGVSGDRSQLNMWLHFIHNKHTQAEMQFMTSSANLGFMLQLQTKHRQCDGISVCMNWTISVTQ